MIAKIRAAQKFVVAAIGLAVTLGILDPGTGQDIAGLVTAVAVYLTPNV